jgi:hypothetical protein
MLQVRYRLLLATIQLDVAINQIPESAAGITPGM